MTAFHSSPRMLGQKQDKFWLTVGLCALTAALIFLPFYLLDGFYEIGFSYIFRGVSRLK